MGKRTQGLFSASKHQQLAAQSAQKKHVSYKASFWFTTLPLERTESKVIKKTDLLVDVFDIFKINCILWNNLRFTEKHPKDRKQVLFPPESPVSRGAPGTQHVLHKHVQDGWVAGWVNGRRDEWMGGWLDAWLV